MIDALVAARNRKGLPIAVREWTVPTYFADASTPRHSVVLRKAPPSWTSVYGTPSDFIAPPPGWRTDAPRWSPSSGVATKTGPSVIENVPIPNGAEPDPELDSHLTVIDRSSGCEYDLYGAYRSSAGWRAAWGNSIRTDSDGIYPEGLSSRASGFAGAAGLIRPEELRAGRIDHALVMAFPNTKAGGPVAPATSSDGSMDADSAIPIGARLQLDPALDLDKLGLRPYERVVARALQEYGMIVGDTGGAVSLYAVHPKSYPSNPYKGLLPDAPYAYLDNIPATRFRVLQLPSQRRGLALNLHPSGCSTMR